MAVFVTVAASIQPGLNQRSWPFDFTRWARFIVRDFFKVQPHEQIVIMANPSHCPEFLDAIRAELLEVHAIELDTILFDTRDVARRSAAAKPRASDVEYRAAVDAAQRRLYKDGRRVPVVAVPLRHRSRARRFPSSRASRL